jgi:hypothetical protein
VTEFASKTAAPIAENPPAPSHLHPERATPKTSDHSGTTEKFLNPITEERKIGASLHVEPSPKPFPPRNLTHSYSSTSSFNLKVSDPNSEQHQQEDDDADDSAHLPIKDQASNDGTKPRSGYLAHLWEVPSLQSLTIPTTIDTVKPPIALSVCLQQGPPFHPPGFIRSLFSATGTPHSLDKHLCSGGSESSESLSDSTFDLDEDYFASPDTITDIINERQLSTPNSLFDPEMDSTPLNLASKLLSDFFDSIEEICNETSDVPDGMRAFFVTATRNELITSPVQTCLTPPKLIALIVESDSDEDLFEGSSSEPKTEVATLRSLSPTGTMNYRIALSGDVSVHILCAQDLHLHQVLLLSILRIMKHGTMPVMKKSQVLSAIKAIYQGMHSPSGHFSFNESTRRGECFALKTAIEYAFHGALRSYPCNTVSEAHLKVSAADTRLSKYENCDSDSIEMKILGAIFLLCFQLNRAFYLRMLASHGDQNPSEFDFALVSGNFLTRQLRKSECIMLHHQVLYEEGTDCSKYINEMLPLHLLHEIPIMPTAAQKQVMFMSDTPSGVALCNASAEANIANIEQHLVNTLPSINEEDQVLLHRLLPFLADQMRMNERMKLDV